MNVKTLTTVCLVLASPAIADTPLDRFESLADEMNVVMLDLMINEIESQGGDGTALKDLGGMMPPWTDEIREAAGCILDAYQVDAGADEVTAMLDRMETVLPQLEGMTMTEATDGGLIDQMSPQGMSLERTMEISRDCGMMELQMEASAASGFMEAMAVAGATIPDNN